MTEENVGRFKDALWFPKEDMEVVVGGAGGIGSWLTLLLCRLGLKTVVSYDFDVLEGHNLSGQLYGSVHVDKPKVVALSDVCKQFTGTSIIGMNAKVTSETMATNFMFGGFDNMEARKSIFECWKNFVKEWQAAKFEVDEGRTTWEELNMLPYEPIYIDGRLSLEQIQIFCVTASTIEEYEKEGLFEDSEVQEAECTLKQTSHTAAMIGGHMVGFFTNHLHNVATGEKLRVVPFLWEYFTPINYSS